MVTLAIVVAVIALVDAVLTLVQRWFSSRIGEGLIYDLRTQVFDHVQRQPVAFFTRTQTGALVSRLNNDVIGAQQAFTSTLSGVVGNVICRRRSSSSRCSRCRGRSRSPSLLLLPLFLLPARCIGRTLAGADPRADARSTPRWATQMTERFNVAGALLVKLFGRPDEEDASSPSAPAGCATSASRIAMPTASFFTALDPGRVARDRAGLRRRRQPGHRRARSRSARCSPSPRCSAGCTAR